MPFLKLLYHFDESSTEIIAVPVSITYQEKFQGQDMIVAVVTFDEISDLYEQLSRMMKDYGLFDMK